MALAFSSVALTEAGGTSVATPLWDPVTGLGGPDAQVLGLLLAQS